MLNNWYINDTNKECISDCPNDQYLVKSLKTCFQSFQSIESEYQFKIYQTNEYVKQCGKYNGTKKLRTTSSTTFTPISETDAEKAISHFPKKGPVRKRSSGYGSYLFFDDYDYYYDPYDGFSERPDNGIYCRDDDSWDYGNI